MWATSSCLPVSPSIRDQQQPLTTGVFKRAGYRKVQGLTSKIFTHQATKNLFPKLKCVDCLDK